MEQIHRDRLSYRIQELHYGGLSKATRRKLRIAGRGAKLWRGDSRSAAFAGQRLHRGLTGRIKSRLLVPAEMIANQS